MPRILAQSPLYYICARVLHNWTTRPEGNHPFMVILVNLRARLALSGVSYRHQSPLHNTRAIRATYNLYCIERLRWEEPPLRGEIYPLRELILLDGNR